MKRKLIKKDSQYYCFDKNTVIVGTTDKSLLEHKPLATQKLSIKNCEAIANGYDLDDSVDYFKKGKTYIQQDGVIILAGEYGNDGIVIKDPLKSRGVGHYSNTWNPKAFCEYNLEALEILGDKKFSQYDVLDVVNHVLHKMVLIEGFDKQYLFPESVYHEVTTKCQSIQQNEWDVEIETEIVPDLDSRNKIDGQIFSTNKKEVPKIDEDGCLILKRI